MKKTNSGIWWNSILHPDTWCNMDELQKHHVKCKQSKKDHVLWNVQRRQIYIEGTWVSGFLGLEVEGRSGEWLLKVSLRHGETVLSSVTQSCHSDTLQPHGLHHTRLHCPSPTHGVYSNSCWSSQRCHPMISSSGIPFSHLQSFPASGSFPRSQFFTSGGQITGGSTSASGLPMNIQDWFPLGLTGLISLQSMDLSRVFSNTTVQKHNPLAINLLYGSTLTSIHTTAKTIALILWTFVGKVMSLLFNMPSRFVIAFLPRGKHLLISWLQSPPAVILEPKKIKSATVSIASPSISHEVMGPDALILVFWMLSFKSTFYPPLSLSRGSLVPLLFLP